MLDHTFSVSRSLDSGQGVDVCNSLKLSHLNSEAILLSPNSTCVGGAVSGQTEGDCSRVKRWAVLR